MSIGQITMHNYAEDKIYKLLNWKVLESRQYSISYHTVVYNFVKNLNNPNAETPTVVLELFSEEMGNDILLSYCKEKNGFDMGDLTYALCLSKNKGKGPCYIMCGEINATTHHFSKVAVIDAWEVVKAFQQGLIRIDSNSKEKTSYIKDGVLYCVTINSNDDFIAIDIGQLTKISPNIVYYQYGFMLPHQMADKEFISEKQLALLTALLKDNNLDVTKNVSTMNRKEASALITFLKSPEIKSTEVQKIIHNKLLLSILGRYTKPQNND